MSIRTKCSAREFFGHTGTDVYCLLELKWRTPGWGQCRKTFLKNLEYLDWFKIRFQTWPKVFLQTLLKTKYLGAHTISKVEKYVKSVMMMMMMMMIMMNCLCGMVDRRKTISLIFSWDHCQRSSPSQITDMLQTGFELAQNLSSGLVEWSCAVVIHGANYLNAHSHTFVIRLSFICGFVYLMSILKEKRVIEIKRNSVIPRKF